MQRLAIAFLTWLAVSTGMASAQSGDVVLLADSVLVQANGD